MKLESTNIQVGDISFCVRHSQKQGRPLILLHGFPDDAGSFDPLLPTLIQWGYQVFVPYMRGYGPTGPDPSGGYSIQNLASDVTGLMDGLGIEEAAIVGHDWGAIAGYGAAQLAPKRVRRLVALSCPPPATFLRGVCRHPGQLFRSRYMGAFQFKREISKETIATLWKRWSPHWDYPESRLEEVYKTFAYPHTPAAAIAYYHQLLPRGPGKLKQWRESRKLSFAKIQPRTTLITGATDGCIAPSLFENVQQSFAQPVTLHVIPGAGHFVHQEAPEQVLHHLRSSLNFHDDGA